MYVLCPVIAAVVLFLDDIDPLTAVAASVVPGPTNEQLLTPEADHVITDVSFRRTRDGEAVIDMFAFMAITLTLA